MKGDKELKMTEDYLDTIDIKLLLERNKGKRVDYIMSIIDKMTEDDWYILGNPDIFEGGVFNWMSECEFIDYVERRYNNIHIFEEISYNIVRQ